MSTKGSLSAKRCQENPRFSPLRPTPLARRPAQYRAPGLQAINTRLSTGSHGGRLKHQPIQLLGVIHVDISPAYELRRDLASSTHDNPWAIRNPLDEARDLHSMTVYGSCTVESIRELISVPPEIEAALIAYADHYPKDGDRIRCVLRFRRKVGVEFERLLQCDMSVTDSRSTDMNEGGLEEEVQSEVQAFAEVHDVSALES